MPATATYAYAGVLLALGIGFFVFGGGTSNTALIPALFGVLFGLLGFLEDHPTWTNHKLARPLAAGLALLLAVSTLPGAFALANFYVTGELKGNPRAAVSRTLTFVASLIYFFSTDSITTMMNAKKVMRLRKTDRE